MLSFADPHGLINFEGAASFCGMDRALFVVLGGEDPVKLSANREVAGRRARGRPERENKDYGGKDHLGCGGPESGAAEADPIAVKVSRRGRFERTCKAMLPTTASSHFRS